MISSIDYTSLGTAKARLLYIVYVYNKDNNAQITNN